MISLSDIRLTVQNYIPYDKGFMYSNGTRFLEDSTKYSIIYDGNAVPYIPYQEYGFTHYKSGKFITVNQHFIQNDTVNALDFLINSASSGEKSKILAQSKRTVQARNNMLSQGTLQSLKGNMNR
jgi:hypothetical protein